jgi:LuxR family maltose regulon positive regulatory protein
MAAVSISAAGRAPAARRSRGRAAPAARARFDLVERPALVARLRTLTRSRLTLVSAPTGYGKTTLLAAWARREKRPVAWVSLRPGDDDVARFWTLVADAVARVRPELAPLRTAFRFDGALVERALPLLVNELAERPGELVLVLDDYHAVSSEACQETVALFLEGLPDNVHLVISARHDPPLRVALARSRGELAELRIDDLRLDEHEVAELVRRAAGFGLAADDARALEERTEGWAAGVYLVALALRDAARPAELVRQFAGSNGHVADYLGEEVLAALPEHLRTFLLRTSLLDRLSAPLCDALLGRDDSHAVLAELERSAAFLVPLDGGGRWFRHQRLFGELLRSELERSEPAELVVDLHRRAERACEAAGLADEAVRHARAAGGRRRAAAVASRHVLERVRTGRTGDLRRLLAAVEPGETLSVPGGAALVRVALPDGDVRSRLADAEELLRLGGTDPVVAATAGAARAFALLLADRAEEARDAAAQVDVATAPAAPAAAVRAAAVRSLALGRLRRHAEAAAWARTATALAERHGVPEGLVPVAEAAALSRSGDVARAEALLESAHDEDEAVGALACLVLTAIRADDVAADASRDEPASTDLSEAEGRVLRLLPARLTQREIARELYLSPNTVKTHTRAIYRKLGASSRTDAVRTARALNLL